jgi:hypothetical protein
MTKPIASFARLKNGSHPPNAPANLPERFIFL